MRPLSGEINYLYGYRYKCIIIYILSLPFCQSVSSSLAVSLFSLALSLNVSVSASVCLSLSLCVSMWHMDRDAEAPLDDGVMERLNKDITEVEVKNTIRNLKNQKASGYDCVMPEMLKLSGNTIVPFLTRCFNKVFTDGTYPEEWTRAVIIPLHKKGDLENPDNYRGIFLLSVISKCYTCVLNMRMKEWMEENEKII